MKLHLILYCLFSIFISYSQENNNIITLEEYVGFVKKYHPVIKQAKLISTESEIKLLKSRGAFDPKFETDFSDKNFKETEYYKKLNSTLKIPTWYGIELKANYENNDGVFLNNELKTPTDGLYNAGVSLSLAKGLLINKRMATLKQAKIYENQALEKQKQILNEIIFDAILTYFNWLKYYQSKQIASNFVDNAKTRLKNIKTSFISGDKPAIDTLEAHINLNNKLLDFEKSKLKFIKSSLEVSNYLWLDNNIPLDLAENTLPDTNTVNQIDFVLNNSILNFSNEYIDNHPKIKELMFKKEILSIDKRLKKNNLLPKIDFNYNFLSNQYRNLNSFNITNYKSELNISIPLFLRKERAELKLANLKIKDTDFDIISTRLSIKNKLNSVFQEIESYKTQSKLLSNLVQDYKKIVSSEERKFRLGEGSIFLINYREVKLIESQLKQIETENKLLISKTNLLRIVNNL